MNEQGSHFLLKTEDNLSVLVQYGWMLTFHIFVQLDKVHRRNTPIFTLCHGSQLTIWVKMTTKFWECCPCFLHICYYYPGDSAPSLSLLYKSLSVSAFFPILLKMTNKITYLFKKITLYYEVICDVELNKEVGISRLLKGVTYTSMINRFVFIRWVVHTKKKKSQVGFKYSLMKCYTFCLYIGHAVTT